MRITAFSIALALSVSPAFAGSTSHGAHGTNHSHGATEQSGKKMVHTMATLNAITDVSVNVSHPPIPALKWPAMTMDLPLMEGAKIGEVAVGGKVMLMLEKNVDGTFGITSVMPVK